MNESRLVGAVPDGRLEEYQRDRAAHENCSAESGVPDDRIENRRIARSIGKSPRLSLWLVAARKPVRRPGLQVTGAVDGEKPAADRVEGHPDRAEIGARQVADLDSRGGIEDRQAALRRRTYE